MGGVCRSFRRSLHVNFFSKRQISQEFTIPLRVTVQHAAATRSALSVAKGDPRGPIIGTFRVRGIRTERRVAIGRGSIIFARTVPSATAIIIIRPCRVADPPIGQPVLSLEKRHYTIGDTLKGNCTSPPSSPPSNVTWYLNDKWVSERHVPRPNRFSTKYFRTHVNRSISVGQYVQLPIDTR